MTFECHGCGAVIEEYDPFKKGMAMPAGWEMRVINGHKYLLCDGCRELPSRFLQKTKADENE
jgi:hypothetical protein